MLDSVKHKTGRIWHASGKHPAARDFLEIGPRDPLLQAFAGWVAGGFRQWSSRHNGENTCNSWRFWSKGTKKNALICGVTRDSSDSLGRPFPLTILGTGQLKGWQSNWEFLPSALSGIWSEVEYLASRRFTDLKQFKDGLGRIKLPASDWLTSANQCARDGALNADSNYVDWDSQGVATHVRRLLETGESIVDLNNTPETDAEKLAGCWIRALKAHLKIVPNMVFLGGMPQKSFMIVINRSLNVDDFVRLWTVALQ